MIEWYLLFLLFPIAAMNRFARGEGKWERWQWYLFMYFAALIATGSVGFCYFWLAFMASYAVPPNSATFCAITGRPPAREDHWLFQWAQGMAHRATKAMHSMMPSEEPKPDDRAYWMDFGTVHGTITGALTFPAVFLITGALGSMLPLVGLMFALKGIVYRSAGWLARRFLMPEPAAVPIAEAPMLGLMIGIYLLICSAAL